MVPGSYYVRDQNIALRRALRELRGLRGRVLEVGCGAGRFLRTIGRHRPDIESHGCDIDHKAIQAAKDTKDGISYILGNLTALPYTSAGFDVVLAFDVLEHLDDPERGIAEAYRVLKPGGILYALVPCEGQPGTLHWLMGKLNLCADLKQRHGGHVQRFTHRELFSMLLQNGFAIERVTYSMHPFGQLRDILTYLQREDWAIRWHLNNPLYQAVMGLLWVASYLESNLLSWLPWSAVAIHVTTRKVRD